MEIGATAVSDYLSHEGNLTPSRGSGLIQSAGLELEGFMFDPFNPPVGCVLPFKKFSMEDLTDDPRFAKEIAGFGIEGRTSPTFFDSSKPIFEEYAKAAIEMWCAMQYVAKRNYIRFLCSGNTPFSFEFLKDYRSWITDKPRFLEMLRLQNMEPYTVNPYSAELPTKGGMTHQEIPMSSAMYALTAQHSLNIGFQGRLGFGANLLYALTPLAAIFSNSRAAGAGIGKWHWNRLQYAMAGMGSKRKLLKFSMGKYFTQNGCHAFTEFLDHCLTRVELIGPDTGLKTSGNVIFPQFRSRASQSWMLSPRISWIGDEDGKISLWAEARAIDAQPTVIEGIALDLLMAGNVSYWHYQGLEDVADLIPHSAVEPTTWKIAKDDPYQPTSTVKWNGQIVQAVSWVRDILIPNALEGIRNDSLCDVQWAERLFGVLIRTLESRCTGSDWVKATALDYTRKGYQEGEALAWSLMDLAIIQADFSPDFANPKGLIDVI